MLLEPEGNQCVDIEKVGHGKSWSSSATWALVNVVSDFPDDKTGIPVFASVTIRNTGDGLADLVRITRSSSIVTSNVSPGWQPRRLRTAPGNTICPLLESFVFKVRRSYLFGPSSQGEI